MSILAKLKEISQEFKGNLQPILNKDILKQEIRNTNILSKKLQNSEDTSLQKPPTKKRKDPRQKRKLSPLLNP